MRTKSSMNINIMCGGWEKTLFPHISNRHAVYRRTANVFITIHLSMMLNLHSTDKHALLPIQSNRLNFYNSKILCKIYLSWENFNSSLNFLIKSTKYTLQNIFKLHSKNSMEVQKYTGSRTLYMFTSMPSLLFPSTNIQKETSME